MNKEIYFIADLHMPFHDLNAVEKVLADIKKNKPKIVVLGGDIVDFYAISHFRKDPNRANMLQEELDIYHDFMLDLRKIFKGKLIYLLGNHECYAKGTEVLTKDGWKDISLCSKDDKLAQFDINTTEISYSKPINIVMPFKKEAIMIEGNNTKQVVSLGHDVVINGKKIKAKKLIGRRINQKELYLTGFNPEKINKYSDDEIRFINWVVMDSTLVYRNKKPHRIQFKLSKQRKIEELEGLLQRMDINYTKRLCKMSGVNKLQPYYIRIYGDHARKIFKMLNNKKELPKDFENLNEEQTHIFLDTLSRTDGSVHYNHITWSTINKHDVDIVYNMCLNNNINVKFNENFRRSGFKSTKKQYYVSIYINGIQSNYLKIEKIEYNNFMYCPEMPKGTVITRYDGKVAFSGNCRLKKYLMENPELYGLRVLRIDNLLGAGKYRMEVCYEWNYKDTIFTHGTAVNKYCANKELNKYGVSGISGHKHHYNVDSKTDRNGEHIWISSPCLCDYDQADYVHDPDWQKGYVILKFNKEKMTGHEVVLL